MNTENKNITIVGAGYVGLSLAVLFSEKHHVVIYDINESVINIIKENQSPIKDKDIEMYFQKNLPCNIEATSNKDQAYENSDFIIVCVPTNFSENTNSFDTTIVEHVIKDALNNKNALIVIKSTIPVGFTSEMQKKFNTNRVIYSPEFLREGKALYDNLYPSRIIVGNESKQSNEFGIILKGSSKLRDSDLNIMNMSSTEAESVKLFSNSYLAMRVAFFNELDSFAYEKEIDSKNIIEGVCLDPRIGSDYNNPSFGYGGYCLPKDTKQLLSLYKSTPQSLISSIVKSNSIRKEYIAQIIINKNPNVVGIYKLSMKKDSDNYRESAILDIINILKTANIKLIIYEPDIKVKSEHQIINSLEEFIDACDLIVANRIDSNLYPFKEKVFTRDIYESD